MKFGRLGEFVADYEPIRTLGTHGPNRHCTGEPKTKTEGYFRGVIRFRGEGGYVHVEAARVKGQLFLRPPWDCDYGSAGASRARAGEAEDGEATLTARSRRDPIAFSVFGSRGEEEPTQSAFIAFGGERREEVNIYRYTFAGSGPAAFEFDNGRGTATVDPPPPFAGSARYLRRPNGRDLWRGTLTAPLLGLGRVHLAGPRFAARMVPKLPNFE